MTGVAVVVLLDILIVLPAVLKLLGRAAWWPTWAPEDRQRPHFPPPRPPRTRGAHRPRPRRPVPH